jgi:aminoglycoside phosphotransferase (APT) family kinase protein
VNADLVRALLAEQFPQLALETIEPVAEGGERAFVVDGTYVFRFATDGREAAKLLREDVLLAELAPRLPLAVPRIELRGGPSAAHPYPFAGYRLIPGRSGETDRPGREHWPAIAAQIGAFLSALHDFPVEHARALGVPEAPEETFGAEYRTRDARTLLARVQRFGPTIRQRLPGLVDAEMERYLSGDVPLPSPSPLALALCHADLKGEHILVSQDGHEVAGVLDWADAAITDPLLDFARLMIWLGEPFVRLALEHYDHPVDAAFLERVCFYGRCFPLDNLGWQLTNRFYAPLELLVSQARWAFER